MKTTEKRLYIELKVFYSETCKRLQGDKSMKNFKKVALLPLVAFGLVACSETPSASSEGPTPTPSDPTDSSEVVAKEAKLVASYASPASMSYMNMRPTYNYYTTTFAMEFLDLYDDGTYCLAHSSSTFSALILPEEGNDATGNERTNTITRFFGTYTSKVNELDEESKDVSLAKPNRMIENNDAAVLIDTAHYSAYTVAGTQGRPDTTYETAEDYYKAFGINAKEILVTGNQFDYFALRETDEVISSFESKEIGPKFKTSYMTQAHLYYMNMRPAYNYYMTTFAHESLEIIDDTHYALNVYSSCFSGLTLPDEGNGATGSERLNYRLSFFGTYTSVANALDDTMTDYTLAAPTRATLSKDAVFFVDSDNWNEAAKTNTTAGETSYNTGKEWVDSFAFKTSDVVTTTENTKSFDFTEFTAQLYQ